MFILSTNQHRFPIFDQNPLKYLILICQLSPIQETNDCNTQTIEFREDGVNHVEGGWPKDVEESDQVRANQNRKEKLSFSSDYTLPQEN